MNGSFSKKTTAFQLLLLAAFTIVAYWPLASFQHTQKWDSVESYFPFRYFLSDCLRNGQLPLWMPYQLGGYPFYADPQSSAWYPLAWIFGAATPYTLKTFATEYIVHFYLAGVGMYLLVRSFGRSTTAQICVALAYTACGFFVSNAEHTTWVVSATWIPWVFWAYHRMTQTKSWRFVLLCALFLYLILSGGYPAFIITTVYILFLFFVAANLTKMPAQTRKQLFGLHFGLAGIFLLLSLGLIISWLQYIPLMSRGYGMNLAKVMVYPFSPRCFESFLLPFATLKDENVYLVDISMRNAYIGLLALNLLPWGIRNIIRERKTLTVFLVTLLCLAAALGDYLPIRSFLYHFVPGMAYFRFPALFRIFSIVGLLILAAQGIDFMLEQKKTQLVWWRIVLAVLLCLCLFILSRSIAKYGFCWHWGKSLIDFQGNLIKAPRQEFVQLQTIVQATLLGLLLLFISIKNGKFLSPILLVCFCLVDMVVATRLNAFGTVVTPVFRTVQEKPIAHLSRDFRLPDNHIPVSASTDLNRNLGHLRTNTSMYFKTIAMDGYNSFQLNSFIRLDSSTLRHQVWSNPYLYVVHDVVPQQDLDSFKNARDILVRPQDFSHFSNILPTETSASTLEVQEFLPNKIIAELNAKQTTVLNLQQSFAKGWKLTVDGQETKIYPSNFTQMASIIPAGNHVLVWSFQPNYIRFLYGFTGAILVLLLLCVLLIQTKLWKI
ncbi:MAG: hypothetical protein JST36_05040 [Bacteroidetes bacterium]|nr:hypothetical protein [Bacteroidota bacterium]